VQFFVSDSQLRFFGLIEAATQTCQFGRNYAIGRDVRACSQIRIVLDVGTLACAITIRGAIEPTDAEHVRSGVGAVAGPDGSNVVPLGQFIA